MRNQRPYPWLLSAAALLVLPAAASAQQSYRIRLKEPDKGDLAEYRKVVRLRVEARMEAKPGKGDAKEPSARNHELGHTVAYLEMVLEKPDEGGKGLKLRRRYHQGERSADGNKVPLPYVGKAILIEKPEGGYKFRVVNGPELSGHETKELDEEFNHKMPQLPRLGASWLLPKTSLRPGQSWTIDPGPFIRALARLEGAKFEFGKATATGKLVRAHRKEGRQYGVLEVRVEVPITAFVPGGPSKLKLRTSKLTTHLVADACIDGSSFAYRLKGVMELVIDGTLEDAGEQSINLRMRFQGDFFESRQEASKE
jgi:hypothetical protein